VTIQAATLDRRCHPSASGKNVLAHSTDVAQRLLRAGLLDEIRLHLVPVLLDDDRQLSYHIGEAPGA
jgi:dihydrofolate reductase